MGYPNCIFLNPRYSFPAELTVQVFGLKSSFGDVHVALYNAAEGFPFSHGIYREKQVLIKNKISSCTFKELTPGNYAVATFHDENKNNKFDQNFFGIPLEDFGFSNQAKAFLGPPNLKIQHLKILNYRVLI